MYDYHVMSHDLQVIVGEYSLNEDGEVTGSTEPDSIK